MFQYLIRYIGIDLFPTSGKYTGHADELFLLFTSSLLPFDGVYTDADKIVAHHLLTLWTNFVKTGQLMEMQTVDL
jgi:hypothetical protein